MYKTTTRFQQTQSRRTSLFSKAEKEEHSSPKRLPENVFRAYQRKMPMRAKITSYDEEGFEALLDGVVGICPFSEIKGKDWAKLVGQEIDFIVMSIHPEVILSSNKAVSRGLRVNQLKKAKDHGIILSGMIIKIIPQGAFVDLGELNGFIPKHEIVNYPVRDPNKVLQKGARVQVVVLKVDDKGEQVSLSMKDVPQ